MPLRTPTAVIGTPNIRLVQALRVTLVAPPAIDDIVARVALTRLTLRGRAVAGAGAGTDRGDRRLDGRADRQRGGVGHLDARQHASGTSRRPACCVGLNNLQADRADIGGTVIDEKSLRIIARDLQQGSRAEAYFRFPAGSQRFLSYRQLRVWMRGGQNLPGWDAGDLQGYIKVESDANNFYMYKTNLHSMGEEVAWNPEVVVDLEHVDQPPGADRVGDPEGPAAVGRGGVRR